MTTKVVTKNVTLPHAHISAGNL